MYKKVLDTPCFYQGVKINNALTKDELMIMDVFHDLGFHVLMKIIDLK